MQHITFYLDFISPYAYLAFEALPDVLQGQSYSVTYKPVFLGAMLRQLQQRGPAEVPGKREWIYRHVQWLAAQQGLPLQIPTEHPFAALGLLRLAVASNAQGAPNRYVCETLLRHVWAGGGDAADAVRLAACAQQMEQAGVVLRDAGSAEVKVQLQAHTDEALALGAFGVPSFALDGQIFWGLDALPMLRSAMAG